ncbi:MAG: AAA family ATPase [Clostridiales bacterium]|nr:AAA family ATPase [Clostridiales bacterium]
MEESNLSTKGSKLIGFTDAEPKGLSKITRVRSSISRITEFTHGYLMGTISVWTGKNGSGKSTFLSQELVEGIDQGFNVMAYNGELPNSIFKHWIERQIAGSNNILKHINNINDYTLKDEVIDDVRKWYRDKLFVLDNTVSANTSNILDTFKYGVKECNVKLFLVDSLVRVGFDSSSSDYYRQQSEFVRKMVSFAKRFNVHVMIVAHPRKTENNWVKKEDISGTYSISDQADYVFSIKKITERDRQKREDNIFDDWDGGILLDKNRPLGKDDKVIGLQFEESSKRFAPHDQPSKFNKQYF